MTDLSIVPNFLMKMPMRGAFGTILVLFFFGICSPGKCQTERKKLKEFPIGGVTSMAIDRLGDFYLTAEGGVIRKYDPEGNFMLEFLNPEKDTTTLLEPWNPLLVFRYVRGRQRIELYDRFFELQQKITVDPAWAIDPVMACPGIANTFWILDRSDWSLKLVDGKTKGVIREASLKLPAGSAPDFTHMREYQNLLFLIDRTSGILIFNTIGTLVRKIAIATPEYIGFLGEEIYYPEDHKLKFFDLYTEEKYEVALDPAGRFVRVTDERMIVVKKESVEVLEFKSEK